MTVKTILGVCLDKMSKTNFLNDESYTDAEQALVDRLLSALNVVRREIAAEYLPLIADESVVMSGEECTLSGLSHAVLYPVRLTDDAGVKHPFRTYPEKLKSDFDGAAVLTYAYLPTDVALSGTVQDMRLTPDILANGTLSEYYFADRVFDLAESYGDSFRSAVSALRYKGADVRVKARRWGV